jgi:hypothetical protein
MQQAMPAQKKVQFSQAIEFIDTFGDDEYGMHLYDPHFILPYPNITDL